MKKSTQTWLIGLASGVVAFGCVWFFARKTKVLPEISTGQVKWIEP